MNSSKRISGKWFKANEGIRKIALKMALGFEKIVGKLLLIVKIVKNVSSKFAKPFFHKKSPILLVIFVN